MKENDRKCLVLRLFVIGGGEVKKLAWGDWSLWMDEGREGEEEGKEDRAEQKSTPRAQP
jgi:hypothetical protein